MDILKQLGVDHTIFYQFAIFFVIFIVLKKLLFEKLQETLEFRESKTFKLEEQANVKSEKAKKMAEEYQNGIEGAHLEAQEKINTNKIAVVELGNQNFKIAEQKIYTEYELEKNQYQKVVLEKKEIILKKAGPLAEELSKKIIEG